MLLIPPGLIQGVSSLSIHRKPRSSFFLPFLFVLDVMTSNTWNDSCHTATLTHAAPLILQAGVCLRESLRASQAHLSLLQALPLYLDLPQFLSSVSSPYINHQTPKDRMTPAKKSRTNCHTGHLVGIQKQKERRGREKGGRKEGNQWGKVGRKWERRSGRGRKSREKVRGERTKKEN